MDIEWQGPYGWPGFEAGLRAIPSIRGVYLWTVPFVGGGFLVYSVGITRRPMPQRFREHTMEFLRGTYTILMLLIWRTVSEQRFGMACGTVGKTPRNRRSSFNEKPKLLVPQRNNFLGSGCLWPKSKQPHGSLNGSRRQSCGACICKPSPCVTSQTEACF